MLIQADFDDDKDSRDLVAATKAVLFFGTPHGGSSFAELGDMLRGIAKAAGFDTAHQNLRDLKSDSAMLEQCRRNFITLHGRGGFKVYSFQEELGMSGVGIAKFSEKVYTYKIFLLVDCILILIEIDCRGRILEFSTLDRHYKNPCQSYDDVQVYRERRSRI
jgi:hypothetical protein